MQRAPYLSGINLEQSFNCSHPLRIVDNSPNVHNTAFFPDCWRLSGFNNRWVHLDTVFRKVFGDVHETKFAISKLEVHVHLKNAFPCRMRKRAITWDTRILQPFVCFPALVAARDYCRKATNDLLLIYEHTLTFSAFSRFTESLVCVHYLYTISMHAM